MSNEDEEIRVRFLRGSADDNNTFTGPEGVLTVDMDQWNLRIHDGETQGGHALSNQTSSQTALFDVRQLFEEKIAGLETRLADIELTLTTLLDGQTPIQEDTYLEEFTTIDQSITTLRTKIDTLTETLSSLKIGIQQLIEQNDESEALTSTYTKVKQTDQSLKQLRTRVFSALESINVLTQHIF